MHEHIPDSANTYIMVDVNDLKVAAFYTVMGVVFVVSTTVMWKRDIKPMIDDRRARKNREKIRLWREKHIPSEPA